MQFSSVCGVRHESASLPRRPSFHHRVPSSTTRRRDLHNRSAVNEPEIDVPELEGSVEYYQKELHAEFDTRGRVLRFPGSQGVRPSPTDVLLYDRQQWGRFRVVGQGALEFLNNKTTNAFQELKSGQGCDTVFCTAKGKLLDLATTYVQSEAVFVILSPNVQESLVPELEKFVFPGDRVEFVDVRSKTRILSLYGSASRELLTLLNMDKSILEGEYGSHQVMGFQGSPVIVAKGNELDRQHGFTMIIDDAISGDLYKNLVDAGAIPIGLHEWEKLRTLYGRPGLTEELHLALNPFEVDLFHAVSLDKGCFLGQESISRVYTRNAIRKHLFGIQLPASAPDASAGDNIMAGEKSVGTITSSSVVDRDGEQKIALGFLNDKVNRETVQWENKEVQIDGVSAVVVALPYMSFDFIDGKGAPKSTSKQDDPDPDQKQQSKEEKLKAMQDRLAAFMKQQNNPQQ